VKLKQLATTIQQLLIATKNHKWICPLF
jgi:hypothetical protein